MGNKIRTCSCRNQAHTIVDSNSIKKVQVQNLDIPQIKRVESRDHQDSDSGSDIDLEQGSLVQDSIIIENRDSYFTKEQLDYYDRLYPKENIIIKSHARTKIQWKPGDLLGFGSFGRVVLGLNTSNGSLMAVKQIHLGVNIQQKKDKIKIIQIEIELLKQLNHRNIVRYIGTQQQDGMLNIFLEYVAGGSISSLLQKYGKFNENLVKIYTKQILEGLEYLHAHRVVHRDIKGANILIDNNGICKLADFGSAKQVAEKENFTSMKGTANWMAPEVIQSNGSGRFSDIWSLGCTVLEMATGKAPWSQKFENPITAMFQIAKNKKPPPIPKELSPEIQDFLGRCFKIIPEQRSNVKDLLEHPFVKDVPSTRDMENQILSKKRVGQQQQQSSSQLNGSTTKKTQKFKGKLNQIQNEQSMSINSNLNGSCTSNVSYQFKKFEEFHTRQQQQQQQSQQLQQQASLQQIGLQNVIKEQDEQLDEQGNRIKRDTTHGGDHSQQAKSINSNQIQGDEQLDPLKKDQVGPSPQNLKQSSSEYPDDEFKDIQFKYQSIEFDKDTLNNEQTQVNQQILKTKQDFLVHTDSLKIDSHNDPSLHQPPNKKFSNSIPNKQRENTIDKAFKMINNNNQIYVFEDESDQDREAINPIDQNILVPIQNKIASATINDFNY